MKNILNKIISTFKELGKNLKVEDIKLAFKEEFLRTKSAFKNFDIKNKRFLNFSMIIVFAVVIFAGGICKFQKIEKINTISRLTILNDGEKAFYNREYEKAIERYEEFFKKDGNPIWYAKISEVYAVEGNLEESRKYITMAKEEENNFKSNASKYDGFDNIHMELFNYIVFNEYMNKDYDVALKDGEEYLNVYKDNKSLIKTMIALYKVTDKIDKARELLLTYPVDNESSYDKAEFARMLILIDKWDDGFKALKEAWNLDKDEYKVYDIIAQIAAYNRDELIQKIAKLIEGEPNEPAYKVWLAKVYSIKSETSDQSIELLEEIKNYDIGKIQINFMKATMLQDIKEKEAADEIIKKIIQEYPEDYRVLHTAGWYYFNKKKYDIAMDFCTKSIEKNKNYPDNYGFLMPEILKAMNKPLEGEPYFRTAMYREPYNYNMLLNIGSFYWHSNKNSEKALEYFGQATAIKPEDSEIKYNMAMINIDENKMDDAINILNQCIKINETIPKYHRTLGTVYMLQGKNEQGIKETRIAYQQDKNDVLNLNNAGCYYINFTNDLERGVYNLQEAYKGLNASNDEYTKTTIKENYEKAKKLLEDYDKGKEGETLTVPELVLFY